MNPDQIRRIRAVNLMIAAQVSLLCGVLVLVSFLCLRLRLLVCISFLLLSLVAPLLAILSYVTTLRLNDLEEKCSSVVRILILTVPLLVVILGVTSYSLPYLYTPPALTRKNIEFYKRCVEFARSHAEHQEFDLLWSGRLYIAKDTWLVHREFYSDELSKRFSEHDIGELRELAGLMRNFRCVKVARRKDIVLFYQRRNIFLPNRPGVAYALEGKNPNQMRSKEVQSLLPFIRVTNDWYCSRLLVLDALRRGGLVRVPRSLIDRATRFEE
ncbi:MAG: hypothetical protein GY774_19005 [Planctomycetes bacterium]|nr:hypothetical protein [Planctomycetota bacterium]